MQEIWISKYKSSHHSLRKKFRKLLKEGKAVRVKEPPYDLREHYIYRYTWCNKTKTYLAITASSIKDSGNA